MYQIDLPSTSTSSHTDCDCGSCQNVGSRKRAGCEDETIRSHKRMKYFYRLASESSEDEVEGTESVYSLQGYETELVMDTPDTDTKSELSDEVYSEVEYDVRSLSEEEFPIGNDSSSGGEDFLPVAGAITAAVCNSSPHPTSADAEESDNSSATEVELYRIGYKTCLLCKLHNTNPQFRYCKKCFQVKRTFFTSRPRGSKRKRNKRKNKDNVILSKQSDPALPNLSNGNGVDMLTPSTSNAGSDEVSNSEEHEKPNGQLVQNTLVEAKELCIMCNTESKNSIFLHGATAHMCCCYRCASKSWKINRKCPACNRRAQNVVKVFVI